jgi:hypothetical protein
MCRGHQKGEDKIAKGNNVDDEMAKQAVMEEYTAGPLLWEGTLLPPKRPQYGSKESKQDSDQENQLGHPGWWLSPEGKLLLLEILHWKILKTLHQLYHLGLDNTLVLVNKMFRGTKLRRDTAQQAVQECET